MDDLIKRIAIGQVWPKAIAAEYADTLTPRQVTMLYEASNVCYEVKDIIAAQAAEIARLTSHLKDAQEIIQRQMGWKTEVQNENERLREALETIKGEMQFPNQLEVGFVHGPITLKDACRRVELARGISSQALQEPK